MKPTKGQEWQARLTPTQTAVVNELHPHEARLSKDGNLYIVWIDEQDGLNTATITKEETLPDGR